jgi:hypothetical protein
MKANLEISVNEDGVWLTFNASNGKSATISVLALANAVHAPITEAALVQWCEDRKKEAALRARIERCPT